MKRKFLLPVFLIIQIIFLQILSFFPQFVEQFYSNGLYPILSNVSRFVLGKIPFSIGDLFYSVLICFVIYWLWKKRKIWKTNWKNNLITITSFFSLVYFLFHLLWGFNYYRVPLFEKMNIKKEYSNKALFDFTEKLIKKTNQIQYQITKNKALKVNIIYTQKQIFEMTQNGYDKLSQKYDFFEYKNPSIKKSLFSLPLTYMGFGGYLNPFTNEAQVNDKLPMHGFPMVVCHEMAHQIGHASESEANFVGFMAATKNDDLYFKYAAYSLALRYCLRNIEMKDPKKLKIYIAKINAGVLLNYEESTLFWQQYESFVETGFKIFYDNFLKMNQQEEGLESYSKFVDLLINYYSTRKL